MKVEECSSCGEFIEESQSDYCIWDEFAGYYLCEECTEEVREDVTNFIHGRK